MKHACLRTLITMVGMTLASLSWQASADDSGAMKPMPGMNMPTDQAASGADSPSTKAYRQGSAVMMKDMDAPYSGDPDADFVAHMIPHHEGAVSMAEVERTYGKDPEMRKLALDIIKAQEKEIALMKRWQEKRAGKQ